MATPFQVITIDMNTTARVMIEETVPNLFRAYFSHKYDDKYEAFIYSGIEDSNHLSLLEDCISALTSRYGAVVGGDNQISDIYKHEEIETILGVKVTKS